MWTLAFIVAAALAIAAPAAAQTSESFIELAPDLSAAIAAVLPASTPVRLSFSPQDPRMRSEMIRILAARGIRTLDSSDAVAVTAACDTNLRERVCTAEIATGDTRRVVITTRPLAARTTPLSDPVVAIEVRPVYAQRAEMLDAADVAGQLLVLTPDAIAVIVDTNAGVAGHAVASQPIRTSRTWPRDMRGMLQASGQKIAAYLPGVVCRGTISPFTVSCADENEAWPIDIDNGGIGASRNTFATPEGLTFFEAASIDGARSLVVNEDGVLTWLDARRRAVAHGDSSDHVAAFRDPCGGGAVYVVTAGRSIDVDTEVLRLWRTAGTELTPAASTIALPGVLTAMWTHAGAPTATAIVHDVNAGRYEAVQISLSCAR